MRGRSNGLYFFDCADILHNERDRVPCIPPETMEVRAMAFKGFEVDRGDCGTLECRCPAPGFDLGFCFNFQTRYLRGRARMKTGVGLVLATMIAMALGETLDDGGGVRFPGLRRSLRWRPACRVTTAQHVRLRHLMGPSDRRRTRGGPSDPAAGKTRTRARTPGGSEAAGPKNPKSARRCRRRQTPRPKGRHAGRGYAGAEIEFGCNGHQCYKLFGIHP